MKITRLLTIFLTALLVTLPLLYLYFNPVYLVHINIQPNSLNGIQLTYRDMVTQHDGNGVVFFDLHGIIQDKSISKIQMLIRPHTKSNWYPQGDGFSVSDGLLIGTAQLGTQSWPVKQDEQYAYLIKTMNDVVLSEGSILATVKPIAGGDRWIVLGIGLLASVLQIVSIFIPNDKDKAT